MGTDIGLHEWTAGMGVRIAALLSALALIIAAVLVTPFADTPMPVSFPMFGVVIGGSIVGNLIVALLLIVQGRTFGSPAMTVLGTGFAFVSAMMVPYISSSLGCSFRFAPLATHGTTAGGFLWRPRRNVAPSSRACAKAAEDARTRLAEALAAVAACGDRSRPDHLRYRF